MAMTAGRRGGVAADINVTPMIDVLLVLLIIFMVVQQGLQRGLSVQVPPVDRTLTADRGDQIVLEVLPGGGYAINRQAVSGPLEQALAAVYAGRPRKVLFVKGGERLTYGQVTAAVDAARAAGVDIVGLVPRTP